MRGWVGELGRDNLFERGCFEYEVLTVFLSFFFLPVMSEGV